MKRRTSNTISQNLIENNSKRKLNPNRIKTDRVINTKTMENDLELPKILSHSRERLTEEKTNNILNEINSYLEKEKKN